MIGETFVLCRIPIFNLQKSIYKFFYYSLQSQIDKFSLRLLNNTSNRVLSYYAIRLSTNFGCCQQSNIFTGPRATVADPTAPLSSLFEFPFVLISFEIAFKLGHNFIDI